MSVLCAISNMLGAPASAVFNLGPELVTNGEFTDDISGWNDVYEHGSASWDSGRMRIKPAVSFQSLQRQVIPVEYGKTYFVTAYVDASESQIYNNVAGRVAITHAKNPSILTLNQGNNQVGILAGMFTAEFDTVNVDLHGAQDDGDVTFFDNVSVREVL